MDKIQGVLYKVTGKEIQFIAYADTMPCPNPLLNTHQCTTSVVYAIIDYSYTATSQILQTKHHPIAHTKTRSKMKTGDSMLGWLSSITHVLCFTHDTSR